MFEGQIVDEKKDAAPLIDVKKDAVQLERRREINRRAARVSRQRKKQLVNSLKDTVGYAKEFANNLNKVFNMVLTHSGTGKITFASPECHKLLGYTESAFMEVPFYSLIAGEEALSTYKSKVVDAATKMFTENIQARFLVVLTLQVNQGGTRRFQGVQSVSDDGSAVLSLWCVNQVDSDEASAAHVLERLQFVSPEDSSKPSFKKRKVPWPVASTQSSDCDSSADSMASLVPASLHSPKRACTESSISRCESVASGDTVGTHGSDRSLGRCLAQASLRGLVIEVNCQGIIRDAWGPHEEFTGCSNSSLVGKSLSEVTMCAPESKVLTSELQKFFVTDSKTSVAMLPFKGVRDCVQWVELSALTQPYNCALVQGGDEEMRVMLSERHLSKSEVAFRLAMKKLLISSPNSSVA